MYLFVVYWTTLCISLIAEGGVELLVNNELKNLWKGPVEAQCEVLFQHMHERQEENLWDISIELDSLHVPRAKQHVHDCNVLLHLGGDTK